MTKVWEKTLDLVDRIPTEDGLEILVKSIFQNLAATDLEKVAMWVMEMEEEVKKDNPPTINELVSETVVAESVSA